MNGLRNDETITLNGRAHPLLSARLRLAHQSHETISVRTEIIHFVLGIEALVRCELTTSKGVFSAFGSASAARDPELAGALVEVAETRSLSRALRWASAGSTEAGAEEMIGMEQALAPRKEPVPIRPDGGHAERAPRSGPPASGAQLRCIRTLARRLGQEADDAVRAVMPGMTLEHLSLPDASKVIDRLKASSGDSRHVEARRAP